MHGELALVTLIAAGDGNGQPCRRAEGFKHCLLVLGVVQHLVVLLDYLASVLLEHEGEQLGKLAHKLLPVDKGHLTSDNFTI